MFFHFPTGICILPPGGGGVAGALSQEEAVVQDLMAFQPAVKDVACGGTDAVKQKGVGLTRHSHAIWIPLDPAVAS